MANIAMVRTPSKFNDHLDWGGALNADSATDFSGEIVHYETLVDYNQPLVVIIGLPNMLGKYLGVYVEDVGTFGQRGDAGAFGINLAYAPTTPRSRWIFTAITDAQIAAVKTRNMDLNSVFGNKLVIVCDFVGQQSIGSWVLLRSEVPDGAFPEPGAMV